MTNRSAQDMIDELDGILDQERQALIQGELDQLEPLLARKDELISSLNEISELERSALEGVQSKVVRNQALLSSAMEGIRAVAARMSELRKVRKGLDVYNRGGHKERFATNGATKLEKRA